MADGTVKTVAKSAGGFFQVSLREFSLNSAGATEISVALAGALRDQGGATVLVDQPLCEVTTDKVDAEIPSPQAGVLVEIRGVDRRRRIGLNMRNFGGRRGLNGGAMSSKGNDCIGGGP